MTTTEFRLDFRAQHDPQAGASYVYLPAHPDTYGCVARTVDAGHGLHLDYSAAGTLIGIEHLWGRDDD